MLNCTFNNVWTFFSLHTTCLSLVRIERKEKEFHTTCTLHTRLSARRVTGNKLDERKKSRDRGGSVSKQKIGKSMPPQKYGGKNKKNIRNFFFFLPSKLRLPKMWLRRKEEVGVVLHRLFLLKLSEMKKETFSWNQMTVVRKGWLPVVEEGGTSLSYIYCRLMWVVVTVAIPGRRFLQ